MANDPRRPVARKRLSRSRLLIMAFLLALALAAVAAAARAAEPAPATRLETGFEERIRTENWDNSTDFNEAAVDARHQWRYRTRAWAKLSFGASTDFAVGLANESKKWTTPKLPLTLDETVFETLFFEHRFADGSGVRVGRQNITRGDGFLLTDGGPLDGSRVAYFNAVDAFKVSGKTRFDAFVISDPYRDRYLPPMHDRKKSLIEWDERALGLYWSGPGCGTSTLDAYGFFKTETREGAASISRQIATAGGRLARTCAGGMSVKAELALQASGLQSPENALAWGGQIAVTKTCARTAKPSLLLGWTGLSGDDPRTDEYEGWDPLFSRFPKWSELYIYTLASEKGAAYWTNLSMWQAEFRATPLTSLDLRLTYYRMDAFHHFAGKRSIYGRGIHRGDLFEARADYKLNDSWRGHVVGEWMEPGDFYAHDDAGWFFRAEVTYGFKRAFLLQPTK